MAITNGYVTLDELKLHVNPDNTAPSVWDAKLENVITSVSRWIDQFCQRHFYQDGSVGTEVARVFDACRCDSYELRLGAFNDVVSVTEVATDADMDGTFETVWAAADFQLLPLNENAAPEQRPFRSIRAVGSQTFPHATLTSRRGLIRVTGIWGWPAVPEPVREACLMQCARIFKRREAPEGVMGFAEFGVVRMTSRLDPDVAANLAPYRRSAVLVA